MWKQSVWLHLYKLCLILLEAQVLIVRNVLSLIKTICFSFAQLPLHEHDCYLQHGSKEDTTPKCSLCHFVVSKLPYCHTHTLDIQYFVVLLLPVCIERDAADFVQHCRCNSSSAPQIIFLLSGDYIFWILFVHGNNFSRPLWFPHIYLIFVTNPTNIFV